MLEKPTLDRPRRHSNRPRRVSASTRSSGLSTLTLGATVWVEAAGEAPLERGQICGLTDDLVSVELGASRAVVEANTSAVSVENLGDRLVLLLGPPPDAPAPAPPDLHSVDSWGDLRLGSGAAAPAEAPATALKSASLVPSPCKSFGKNMFAGNKSWTRQQLETVAAQVAACGTRRARQRVGRVARASLARVRSPPPATGAASARGARQRCSPTFSWRGRAARGRSHLL